MFWHYPWRKVSIIWPPRDYIVQFEVPLANLRNHKFEGTELLMQDYDSTNYHPVGLQGGEFSLLEGSGTNYVIEDGILKLIDISDAQYYTIGLYNGSFVVLEGTGDINYIIEGDTLKLLDIWDGKFYKVGLFQGSFIIR